jgi:outer membrane immunogenic protein
MMRRILLASAGAMALAGTALAADMPMAAPPPPPLWTGFYIGVNAGYDWSASNSVNTTAIPGFSSIAAPQGAELSANSALAATFPTSLNPNGFIGGGQIGYNYQFANSWVVGIEADIDGIAGAKSNATVFGGATSPDPALAIFPISQTATVSKSIDYLGTVRGRFGFLLTPTLLIYGDGGLAYGGVQSNTGIVQSYPAALTGPINQPFFGFGQVSNTKVGWTAGGGAEWMFLPNWSAKIEYSYYDLGSVTYRTSPLIATLATNAVFSSAFPRTSTRFNGNVVRAGINYHFNWGAPAAVVAKY